MKPLFPLAVLALILSVDAHDSLIKPENEKDLVADEGEPKPRNERCTTCGGGLSLKSPHDVLAAIQALPGAEVHTQQTFEGCSSEKGCAGLKVKDGQVIEKFGNIDAFKAAAAADTGNEFQFQAGGLLDGNLPGGQFWWMNQQNSPFKNAANGGGYEKFSKSSSSFSSSGGGGVLGAGGVDLGANPFLNGDFSKLGGNFAGAIGADGKPSYSSSSFESSSFSSSSKGDVDLAKNPFLNGGIKIGQAGFGQGFGAGGAQFGVGASGAGNQGQTSFNSQSSFSQSSFGGQGSNFGGQGKAPGLTSGAAQGAGFGASGSAFNSASSSKFGGSGYTGSSPSPFTASSGGSNVNLIQNTQKASEFEFDQNQQTQQNIDEAFQSTGNVLAHEHTGGDLQQTCAGQGYVCVHKAQCNNGVVNSNGANVLQAKTQKQYCNTRTEICCRIEVSTLSGAGGLQGSLGVGSATFQGSNQGSGLFVGQSESAQGSFGTGQFGANGFNNGFGNRGQGSQTTQGSSTFESSSSSFGSSGTGFQSGASGNDFQSGASGSGFQSGASGSGFQATGSSGSGLQATFGSDANRGVSSTSSFESGSSFNSNKFGASGSGSYGNGFSTVAPTTNRFNSGSNFNNEVYKSTSQSNFVGSDSFSAGSETADVFRPGAGPGLKPGIPYLPPDNINQPTFISSTVIPTTFTTPRPFTPRPVTVKPTYLPPVSSTSAPGYLPPQQSSETVTKEVKVRPVYDTGSIILDETRNQPTRRPAPVPVPSEYPSGCAAALKCTPVEFCTAEGVISNTTVALTRDQEAYRVPLTDCKDLESGRIGKCCRDPYYTDPWPTNQLGKWVPNVFGGNDGKYVPDSKNIPTLNRPVTVRPPVTGSVNLQNTITPKPTIPTFGVNQVTPGFPGSTVTSFAQKGQFGVKTQGSFGQGGRGQVGINQGAVQVNQGRTQTQLTQGGQQFGQGKVTLTGQGQVTQTGQGQITQNGQGFITQNRQDQFYQNGQGQITQNGQGQFQQNNQGQITRFGQGQNTQTGQGIITQTGQGQFQQNNQGQITQTGQRRFQEGGQGQITQTGQGQFQQNNQGQTTQTGQRRFQEGGQGQITQTGQGVLTQTGQGVFTQTGQGTQFGQTQFGGQEQGFSGQGIQTQGSKFGQTVTSGQGQIGQGGNGQFGVGSQGQIGFGGAGGQVSQFESSVSQTKFSQGGQGGQGGQGQIGQGGLGIGITNGGGQFGQSGLFGQGTFGQGGLGIQFGNENGVSQQGFIRKEQGFGQNFASRLNQGQGQAIVQGQQSEIVNRVFLGKYDGTKQNGVLNGQKPYGNRNELEVDFAEIPWQAMVLLQTNRSLLCGGVITRPDVVVTSASCVEGLDAKNVLIKGGEWKLGIDDEPLPFQIVQVKTIIRHPFYKAGSLKYDAAILVLSENLRLAKNIYPIALPGPSETLDAFYNGAGECIVTGWGKIVLQAHLEGAIMHSLNVSLLNPGECEAKLSQDYPHLLEQYDQDSCACGQPLNPVNNICKVDTGSALACTTDNTHYVLRGVYSWDSGCQTGNQIAAFYKFDLDWYLWAIGQIESSRFASFNSNTQVTQNRVSGQINSAIKGGSQFSGVKGGVNGFQSSSSSSTIKGGFEGSGLNGFQTTGESGQFGFSQFGSSNTGASNFATGIKGPISKTFSASYTEKKVFKSPPKIFTYTTEPKIITYTTEPKIVTFTTKPQIITYEASMSGPNPQYVAPGVTFNPSFSEVTGHKHSDQCKCLEKGKK